MFLLNLLEGEAAPKSNNTATIIVMIGLIVVIIALLVWSNINAKKKQKEAQEIVNALKIGDRVKTIGGVCGFVAEINDAENTFVLETGTEDKKSFIKFDKGAIYQTAPAQGNAVAAKPVEEKKEAKDGVATSAEKKTASKKPAKKQPEKQAEEVKAEEKTEE